MFVRNPFSTPHKALVLDLYLMTEYGKHRLKEEVELTEIIGCVYIRRHEHEKKNSICRRNSGYRLNQTVAKLRPWNFFITIRY